MNIGNVVEYIDSEKIVSAVILDVKKLRLRLLTENNREVKLSANRISLKSNELLDLSVGRDKLVESLKRISGRRKALIDQVNIKELWEVLGSEQEWIDLVTMTEFCFPNNPTSDHQSAVIRAFFNNRLYFKFNFDRFFPNSEEKVNQIISQIDKEYQKKSEIEVGASWVRQVLSNEKNTVVCPMDQRRKILQILKSYYLFGKDSPNHTIAKGILKKAGYDSVEVIFKFLVKINEWSEHENIDLYRYGIETDFSENVSSFALRVNNQFSISSFLEEGREDLTDLDIITVDGQYTLDFDDAISIQKVEDDRFRIGIHITDVGHYIKKGDLIDEKAMMRASSIYMPDQKISMIPPYLSENLCSLKEGTIRPSISTFVEMNSFGKILDFRIISGVIRVKRQLTYYDVTQMAENDPDISLLYNIANNFRNRRIEKGAIQIVLPEVNIWINPDQSISVTKINRESPGRLLISELMILANWLNAKVLSENGIPAIFRSQPPPRERLFSDNDGSLFHNWMQRKLLSRFILSSHSEAHNGLGLDAYTTLTSPIRKYFDLLTQRQIRAYLNMEIPYAKDEIDRSIQMLEQPMGQIAKIQIKRNRYWLLKYLETKIGQKEEALVLSKRKMGYMILLKNYLIECFLSLPSATELRPEDLIQVTIQHVNARNDALVVFIR